MAIIKYKNKDGILKEFECYNIAKLDSVTTID